jgi:hypothetical protein
LLNSVRILTALSTSRAQINSELNLQVRLVGTDDATRFELSEHQTIVGRRAAEAV